MSNHPDLFAKLGGDLDDFDENDPQLQKELQAMGWKDDDIHLEEDDPEAAELNAMMKEHEEGSKGVGHLDEKALGEVLAGGNVDLDNVKIDDKDLDDPDLLDDLNDLDADMTDEEKKEIYEENKKQFQEVTQKANEARAQAVKLKTTDKKAAVAALRRFKELDKEKTALKMAIDAYENPGSQEKKIAKVKEVIQERQKEKEATSRSSEAQMMMRQSTMQVADDLDQYHNVDKLVSNEVMDAEIALIGEQLKTAKGNIREELEERKSNIEFKQKMLGNNVNTGLLTLDQYIVDVKNMIASETKLAATLRSTGKKEHADRIAKRIQIMKQEVEEAENAEEEEEEEEEEEKAGHQEEEEKMEISSPNKGVAQNENLITDPKTLETEMEIDFSSMSKEDYELIQKRFQDYKEAAMYALQTGHREPAEKLLKIAEELRSDLKLAQQNRAIDIGGLAAAVTPSLITGWTEQERREKFDEVIGKISEAMEYFKSKALDCMKAKPQKKEMAMKYNKKRKEYEELVNFVNKKFENPWQLPPVFSFVDIEEKTEKMNEDIKQNEIEVNLGKVGDFLEGDFYAVVNLQIQASEGQVLRMQTEPIKDLRNTGFNFQTKFSVQPFYAKKLDKKRLIVEIWKNNKLCGMSFLKKDAVVGQVDLKLTHLATHCDIESVFPIKLQEKKRGSKPTLELKLRMRNPTQGKEMIAKKVPIIKLERFPDPYRTKEGERIRPVSQASGSRQVVSATSTPANTKAMGAKTTASDSKVAGAAKGGIKSIPIPEELTPLEIKDPDHINNLNSNNILEDREKALKAQFDAYIAKGQPVPEAIKTKYREVVQKLTTIQTQVRDTFFFFFFLQFLLRKLGIRMNFLGVVIFVFLGGKWDFVD